MTLDRYDDQDRFLKKVCGDKGIPDIVKTAAYADDAPQKFAEDYAAAIETQFGTQLKYPIMDAGNAVASAIYFDEYGSNLPADVQKTAAAKIKEALVGFGYEVPEGLDKTATAELGFSDGTNDAHWETVFGLTSDNTMEVIEDAFKDCSPTGKRRLMLQVKEAGIKMPSTFEDYARDELGSDLSFALEVRKHLVDNRDAHAVLEKILEKSASTEPADLVDDVYAFDITYRVAHLYDKCLPDPVASVFGTTLNKTASYDDYVSVNGHELSGEDFGSFVNGNYDKISEHFGDKLAEQLKSDPVAVFNSLPTPHKTAIGNFYKA